MKSTKTMYSQRCWSLCAVMLFSAIIYAEELVAPGGPIRGDNPNIGIKYDKNQGLFVTPFSAKLLGFKTQDVEEKRITSTKTVQARIFDMPPGGKAKASAWLPHDETEQFSVGMPVKMEKGYQAAISQITPPINGLAELILNIADPQQSLKLGKFLEGTIEIETDGEVVAVPKSAIVKSAEGVFAYVDNAGWTTRTEVEIGAEQDDLIEIVDGIYSGDLVVTAPVMTLWLTELQLLKSGKA